MPRTELRPARRLATPPLNPPPQPPTGSPEGLAQHWLDTMRTATPADLANLLEVLEKQPSRERSIVQNIALARARKEEERRSRRAVAVGATAPSVPTPIVALAAAPAPAPTPAVPALFTAQEQADIRRLYPTATWPELLLLAPSRTRSQIMSWAIYHGLKRTKQAKATAQSAASKGKPKKSKKEERQPATPVLNARVSAKAKKDGPSPIGRMLEQMRQLLPSHPRRMAYALAARTGTGQDAYLAWKNWKPQSQNAA